MAKCKRCGLPVDWVKIGGRRFCYDKGTGIEHWSKCSSKRWESVRKGVRFESKMISGYVTEGKVYYEMISSGFNRGKEFKQSDECGHCCPPWEICSKPCPDAIA